MTIPQRLGTPPVVVGPAPHGQRSQTSPILVQEELWGRMTALPYVYMAPTLVSVPLARSLFLPDAVGSQDLERFQGGREFLHLHPHHDSSLHAALPDEAKNEVERSGWGVRHPVQRSILLYGPRDRDELEVIWTFAQWSYDYAMGR